MDKPTLIKPLGTFFPISDQGVVENPASASLVPFSWHPVLKEVVRFYQRELEKRLHSVWLRGSLARGTWEDSYSDADFLALVYHGKALRWEALTNESVFVTELQASFPFVKAVEMMVSAYHPDLYSTYPQLAMLLKTQAIPLWGPDIRGRIPEFRPGPRMWLHSRWLKKDIDAFFAKAKPTPADCQHLMKVVIRSGAEWVMEKDQRYAVDLYPCVVQFEKYYPEWADSMWEALRIYLNPVTEKGTIAEKVGALGGWLVRCFTEGADKSV